MSTLFVVFIHCIFIILLYSRHSVFLSLFLIVLHKDVLQIKTWSLNVSFRLLFNWFAPLWTVCPCLTRGKWDAGEREEQKRGGGWRKFAVNNFCQLGAVHLVYRSVGYDYILSINKQGQIMSIGVKYLAKTGTDE